MMQPLLSPIPKAVVRSIWPLALCFVLVFTTQASITEASPPTASSNQHRHHQRGLRNARFRRPRPFEKLRQRGGAAADTQRQQSSGLQGSVSPSTCSRQRAWMVRGGGREEGTYEDADRTDRTAPAPGEQPRYMQAPIEKVAADLRAKRDDIAADVLARGQAIASELKVKQEKIADEVLRDRSPEAFGELGGHASYDSATAGMDVANRRSFFLGIRRVILLVQVVELMVACLWQAAFPYGGVAGFVGAGSETSATSPEKSWVWDARGKLGLAVAASVGQAALYTSMLVFYGCDRVVLRAVRVTGWEHGAAAAWILFRAFGALGKLSHLAPCAWLAGMAFLCAYFGRQL